METQLTALERKIDELLATVATPKTPDPDKDRATAEPVDNAAGPRGARSEEK